jgi:hypothetical protein
MAAEIMPTRGAHWHAVTITGATGSGVLIYWRGGWCEYLLAGNGNQYDSAVFMSSGGTGLVMVHTTRLPTVGVASPSL